MFCKQVDLKSGLQFSATPSQEFFCDFFEAPRIFCFFECYRTKVASERTFSVTSTFFVWYNTRNIGSKIYPFKVLTKLINTSTIIYRNKIWNKLLKQCECSNIVHHTYRISNFVNKIRSFPSNTIVTFAWISIKIKRSSRVAVSSPTLPIKL